ncbi:MAG: hypothetical protein ACRD2N_17730 [Vicinamibacterales bacterium]
MTINECSREEQVVHAVLSGAWPGRCDHELTSHAAQCEVCSEVVAVATALRADHDEARCDVHVPAAGQVWWRAAVRARLETAHASTQPMTWLHGVTAAMTIGLTLAAIGIAWPSIAIAAEWTKSLFVGLAPQPDVAAVVIGALRQSFIVALVAGAGLVLAPVALYFALSDD